MIESASCWIPFAVFDYFEAFVAEVSGFVILQKYLSRAGLIYSGRHTTFLIGG